MLDWERASVPYRPIYRRRLLRRRVLTVLIIALITIPYYAYHRYQAAQPIGERVFDQVTSTVALRYFDRGYHGVAWQAVSQRYRPLVVNAPSTAARYAALRSMLAQLHDSHTAVYSPGDLQPPRDERRHAVFGMVSDAATTAPAVDWKTLASGVGYLRLSSFPDSMHSVLAWAMDDLGRDRALILDLRGNPGGLVDSVDEVAGIFLPKGTLISTGTRRYNLFGSQQFRATDDSGVTYRGRLVVLVDKNSRSGAESLARALQYYHRATLVGTRTAGKVLGVDAEMSLADGGLLRVATLDMHAPDGQRLEGHGVTPEIVVSDGANPVSKSIALVDGQDCSVIVTSFDLNGTGLPNGYARYAVGLRALGQKRYEARLEVGGDPASEPRLISASPVFAEANRFFFYWPSSNVSGITVKSVVDTTDGSLVPCGPSDPRRPSKPSSPETAVHFDDSNVQFPTEIHASTAVEASFIFKKAPSYPNIALEQGLEGKTTVRVWIGPTGQLIDANVWVSSGSPILDEAAVRAARESTYSAPVIGGNETTAAYLIEYVFRIRR